MKLRYKVILILLSTFALYTIVASAIQRLIILPRFLEFEQSEIQRNMLRVVKSIRREIFHLDKLCHDWASWNDTYDYINKRSPEYINSNLAVQTFQDNRLNVVYICDIEGKVVWKKFCSQETGKEVSLPLMPQESWPLTSPLLKTKGNKTGTSGLFTTSKGPLLIAARPILTSSNEGPSRGFMIQGRFLDEKLRKSLIQQTEIDFSIEAAKSKIENYTKLHSKNIKEDVFFKIDKLTQKVIDASSPMYDIHGYTALILKTTTPRDITERAFISMRFALYSIICIGIVVLFAMLLLLQRTVLSPIGRLSKTILFIENKGDYSKRVKMDRQDEIGSLADEFDFLLEKIEEQTCQLNAKNQELLEDIKKRHEIELKLQEANAHLRELATIDELTQLGNRRSFDIFLTKEWRRMKRDSLPLSLLLLDVDHFKKYNDYYGHQAGDECLSRVARILSASTHRASDFTARYGGEEFAIVLPSTDLEGAIHFARDLCQAIETAAIPHEDSTISQFITASIGVATITPTADTSVENLIAQADSALYEAKARGRNRVSPYPTIAD